MIVEHRKYTNGNLTNNIKRIHKSSITHKNIAFFAIGIELSEFEDGTSCTSQDYLVNKAGRHFSIVPGMIATVDIKTGEKTVLDYLIKPFNRAKEALRER